MVSSTVISPRISKSIHRLCQFHFDLIEVQKYRGHHSIFTTVRTTHLTDQTKHRAIDRINGLMDRFAITRGQVT